MAYETYHICDRCKARTMGGWRLEKVMCQPIVKERGFETDLCPDCLEELKKWLQPPRTEEE